MKKKSIRMAMLIVLAALMCLASCTVKKDTVVMEYHGHTITESMYYYWVSTYKRNILLSYSDAFDTDEFWNTEYDGKRTVGDYFGDIIRNRITDYLVADYMFRELKLSLDPDVKSAINDDIAEKIEYYGGKKALNKELGNINLSVDILKTIYTMEQKYNALFEKLTGDGGILEPDEEDVTSYYSDNYSRIKYIVFYTTKLVTDENGNYVYDDAGSPVMEEMSAEELAAKEEMIEKCILRLDSGEDFDEIMAELSEYDTSAYENGFFVSSNELSVWGEGIIAGAKEAKENSVFRVNEDYAVYIVKKLPLTPFDQLSDSDISQLSSLATYVKRDKAESYFSSFRALVTANEEILGNYTLSSVRPNPYYGF